MIPLVLLLTLLVGTAQAEESRLYVYGAIGQASGSLTDKPGLWRQEGLPYDTSLNDLAYKAGLGYQFTSGFFIESGLVDPGRMSIHSLFVSDHLYDPDRKRCKKSCNKLHELWLDNDYLGGELVVGYKRTLFDFFRPYGKAGVAGFSHSHSGTFDPYGKGKPVQFSHDGNDLGQNFSGMMIAAVVGGGLCAPAARVEVCGDVSHYIPVAHTANPLVDSLTMATAYLNVPLTGW